MKPANNKVETEPAHTTVNEHEKCTCEKRKNIGHESKRILKAETGRFFQPVSRSTRQRGRYFVNFFSLKPKNQEARK